MQLYSRMYSKCNHHAKGPTQNRIKNPFGEFEYFYKDGDHNYPPWLGDMAGEAIDIPDGVLPTILQNTGSSNNIKKLLESALVRLYNRGKISERYQLTDKAGIFNMIDDLKAFID